MTADITIGYCDKCLQGPQELEYCLFHFVIEDSVPTVEGVKRKVNEHYYCKICTWIHHQHEGEIWL